MKDTYAWGTGRRTDSFPATLSAQLTPAEKPGLPCMENSREKKKKGQHRGLMEGLTAHSARVKHVKMLNCFCPLHPQNSAVPGCRGHRQPHGPAPAPLEVLWGHSQTGVGMGRALQEIKFPRALRPKGFVCLAGAGTCCCLCSVQKG